MYTSGSTLAAITSPLPKIAESVLIFAYYFPPENESGAARPGRFSKYLQRAGWTVNVISRSESECGDVARQIPVISAQSPTALSKAAAGFAQRFVLPYNDALPWTPHAIASARSVLLAKRPAVLFSTSPPTATHIAAMLLKRQTNLPWVADFRDPLRGNYTRSGMRSALFDSALERAIFQTADALIANTDELAESWKSRYPRHAHKISVIYNGFDPDEEISAAPVRDNGIRVITHAGTIYGGRHPGLLLASTRRLIERNALDPRSLQIRLIGRLETDSVPEPELIEWHRMRGCLELVEPLPKQDADREAACSDYLLLLDNNRYSTSMQVPAKLFTYIRLGRFILALTPKNSPTARILANSGVPHACLAPDAPPGEVDRTILSMMSRSSTPVEPSAWFNSRFNTVSQTASLISVFEQITQSRGLRRRE